MGERKEYDNSGILFKNRDKEQATHADYKGNAKIDGVDYWIDAYINEGAKGKFLGLRFKRKDQRPAAKPAAGQPAPKPGYEEPDDIPFRALNAEFLRARLSGLEYCGLRMDLRA